MLGLRGRQVLMGFSMSDQAANPAVVAPHSATGSSAAPPEGPAKETTSASGSSGKPPTAFDPMLEISAIYDRLRQLESGAKEEKKEHWYNSPLFSSVLSGVILAIFGFFLTGRLEQAAKEQELNITSAKDMQELLVKISTGSRDEAEAAAVALTTYGRYSIPPLIENLQYGPERALAAEHGLEALMLTVPEDLCSSLGAVLQNRTQRYTAASHTAVIRIMGAANCTGETQIQILREYADLMKRADAGGSGLAEYQQVVRDATAINVTQAKQELTNTFRLLHVNYAF
jgi:hypothetical protein